ncbi:FabD/lysophospholipase-like protein [Rhizodiscina lignyota]|uniref:FabD/lysophospholipase-like protein n=1 Tax=Rhizodiscina lignyota TaxID=1504668 RepID=A0A9P4MF57_9PEZI|nr:FabD/lysophospholipase-like protein [Rhizodiscina lignyota]
MTITHELAQTRVTRYPHAFRAVQTRSRDLPQFVVLVGKQSKSSMLRTILDTPNDPLLRGTHGQIYIRADTRSNRPLYYIDCEANLFKPKHADSAKGVGPSDVTKVNWLSTQRLSTCSFGNLLCADVLAPLSSLVCYFAADLGGLRGVARLLAEQLLHSKGTDLPPEASAAILIITDTRSATFEQAVAESRMVELVKHFIAAEAPIEPQLAAKVDRLCKSLRVIGFHNSLNLQKRCKTFRSIVSAVSDAQATSRSLLCLAFSARHAEALFTSLLHHFSTQNQDRFSFVDASRPDGFSISRFPQQLQKLLQLMPSEAYLWHSVVPYVANALLLASFPPGSHCEWILVCRDAIQNYTHRIDIQEKFLSDLEHELERQLSELQSQQGRTALHYTKTLRHLNSEIPIPKSHELCSCLMRMPERDLSCGHSFCETCLQLIAQKCNMRRYHYTITGCPACGEEQKEPCFRLLPPTAGVRLLSIDGGGVRGVIPLMVLSSVEKSLSYLQCPLRDYFDLILGSSAGGVVSIGIGVKQWSTDDCLGNFEKLVYNLFSRKSSSYASFHLVRDFVQLCLSDCQYDSELVNTAFSNTFGRGLSLFSTLSTCSKVGVTTTRVRDAMPCLITNYNGTDPRQDVGYHIVRAEKPQEDIQVADAAICTSAAPWFFKPKAVPRLDTYEDGSLQENNPIAIALSEFRTIWPNRGEHPDIGLSLGTGWARNGAPRGGSDLPVRDRMPTRLARNFKQSLNGQKIWRRFFNTLPNSARHRYHRLEPMFGKEEPRIDELTALEDLKSFIEDWMSSNEWVQEVRLVLDGLIASIFYFELDALPEFIDGRYHVSGQILCRLNLSRLGQQNLYEMLRSTKSYFLVNGDPKSCLEAKLRNRLPFRKRIEFSCEDGAVAISIGGITSRSCSISGMPRAIDDLIRCQKLDAPFGTVEHDTMEKPLPSIPTKRKVCG